MKNLTSIFLFLVSSVCLFAQTNEKRIALVIGNANYQYGNVLTYPLQDALTMKNVLQELKFEVIYVTDANQIQMKNAFIQFIRKIENANVSLIYYSGHGQQIDGVNYLIPVDANITDKISAIENTININNWVSKLEVNEKNLNIVILDACRNNRFKSFSKGNENGLKPIPAPSGTIIAFATNPDNVAQDNGLYAQTLAIEMRKSQRIDDVFRNTRKTIKNATNGNQVPMEWMMNDEVVYLKTEIKQTTNSNEIIWEDNKYGFFTDSRDNHKYKVVKIGEQIWLAENLAYKPSGGNYWFPNNDINTVANFGYLYDWETSYKSCPIDWHLATYDDWKILTTFLGDDIVGYGKMKLSDKKTNISGFNCFPAGRVFPTDSPIKFDFDGDHSYYWTSTRALTVKDEKQAWFRILRCNDGFMNSMGGPQSMGLSVRCVKD